MVRNIFKIFASSPFEPLTQHLQKCGETAAKVPEIIESLKSGDAVHTKELAKQVMVLEHEADEIKHEIRDHLPKTLFLPVDRRDLLRLLSAQDEIADRVEDLAVVATLKPGLPVPQELVEELDRVTGLVMDCVKRALELGDAMEDLLEAGFAGPEAQHVQELIKALGEQEHVADKRQYKFSQKLIIVADQLKKEEFALWVELIKNLGRIANSTEKYSKELRNILAR
jgi:predicted phosphate transport protein (TIGR00153 family)